MSEEEFSVLWPGGASAVPPIEPARRPNSLDGKRIALLWDYMFRGEEIFPILDQALHERFPEVEIVGYDTFGSTFGGDEHAVLEALPGLLKEHRIDAAISGIGC